MVTIIASLILIQMCSSFTYGAKKNDSYLGNLQELRIEYSMTSPDIIINYDLMTVENVRITLIHESCKYMKIYDLGKQESEHHEFFLSKDKLPAGEYVYFIEAGSEIKSGNIVVTGFVAPKKMIYLPSAYINDDDKTVELNYELRYPCHVKMTLFHENGNYLNVLEDQDMDKGKYQIEINTAGLEKGLYTYILESDYGISSNSFFI